MILNYEEGKAKMTEMKNMVDEKYPPTVKGEEIHINHLLHDVLIIKAESLNDYKIFSIADYLEKQLLKIKRGDASLEL